MRTLVFSLSFGALAACTATTDKDTGDTAVDTGDTSTDTDTDTDTGTEDVVSSCNWPTVGLCFEFVNYANSDIWCDGIASEYGFTTEHAVAPCSTDGVVGTCDIAADAAPDDDFDFDSTAYYYESSFTAEEADEACLSAGGSPA